MTPMRTSDAAIVVSSSGSGCAADWLARGGTIASAGNSPKGSGSGEESLMIRNVRASCTSIGASCAVGICAIVDPRVGRCVMAAQGMNSAARAAMEAMNAEAAGLHIWLRTQANAPAQRAWFHDGGLDARGQVAPGPGGAHPMKAAPHRLRRQHIT